MWLWVGGLDNSNTYYNHQWHWGMDGILDIPSGGDIRRDGLSVIGNATVAFDPYTADANGQIYLSSTYYKENPDQGSADFIDTDVALTRANQGGLFNALYDYPSPTGTLWNSDGWDDLTNVQNRKYITFFASANGKLGVNVINKYFIMKDTINNKYYKIQFTVWQQGGGNFTYTRQQIDGTTGSDIGSPVTFAKTANGQIDEIDTSIKITRNSNQGIYNPDLEGGWNNTQPDTPTNTEWNADGWQDLSDVTSRTYTTLLEVSERYGYLTNQELVMHDTTNNKYYTFKFSNWQVGGNGGAFSYERKEINTSIYFNREDGADDSVMSHVDNIAPGITITRSSSGFIYNTETEGSWNWDISPDRTLWNADGWDDLSNITERQYSTFGSFYKLATGQVVLNNEYVMHDTYNDEYWAVRFNRWQQGNNAGGPNYPGFSYVRRKLKVPQTASGVHFADGTIQNTAISRETIGVLPQKKVDVVRRYVTLQDVGKHLYVSNSSCTYIGIPDSGKNPFPIGSQIIIVNRSGVQVIIQKDNDNEGGTIYGSGLNYTSSTWYLPDNGGGAIATLTKIADYYNGSQRVVDWILSGPNITD